MDEGAEILMGNYLQEWHAGCRHLFPQSFVSVEHKDCKILTGSKQVFSGSYFTECREEGWVTTNPFQFF